MLSKCQDAAPSAGEQRWMLTCAARSKGVDGELSSEDVLAGSWRCSDSSADELALLVLHSSSSDEQLASEKELHGVPAHSDAANKDCCNKLVRLCVLLWAQTGAAPAPLILV